MSLKSIAIAVALAGPILAGCTSTLTLPTISASDPEGSIKNIENFTVADLQAADADAVTNGDNIAHTCYPALIQFVQGLPSHDPNTTVKGAFYAFQRGRDLRNVVARGIPDYVTIGCGPLYAQVHGDLLKFLGGGMIP